jgi:hypothetical protein
MFGKTCDVRIYQGPCDCNVACERCCIGCNRPARHKNPFFGVNFNLGRSWVEGCVWWQTKYSYAEYLCAEHYDEMASFFKSMESDPNCVEDPEYTKILETL